MYKVVIAGVLLAHGIGHSMGLLQLFNLATVNSDWQGGSWLITGAASAPVTQLVGGLLWTIAIIGFSALATAVLGLLPSTWIAPLAIASSIASMIGLVLFPVAFPVSSTVGALAVDVTVLIASSYHWLLADSAA